MYIYLFLEVLLNYFQLFLLRGGYFFINTVTFLPNILVFIIFTLLTTSFVSRNYEKVDLFISRLLLGNFSSAITLAALNLSANLTRQTLEPKIVSSQIGVHPINYVCRFKLFEFWGIILGPLSAITIIKSYKILTRKENTNISCVFHHFIHLSFVYLNIFKIQRFPWNFPLKKTFTFSFFML